MLTKIKSAASVQTFGSAEVDVISNAKVSERLGTTHGSINLVQTYSEKRYQDPESRPTEGPFLRGPNPVESILFESILCN